jgi:2-methylcitrate dehydratase PrpD
MSDPDVGYVTSGGAARAIAAFAQSFEEKSVDASLQALCARSLADTYAVAIAGQHEAAATAARRYLDTAQLTRAIDQATGMSTLWAQQVAAAPEIAAWYNGIAGHVLDYDDVTVPMRGHPSVVLWPALLALGEARDLPGSRLVAAYIVGFEVICKISHATALGQYRKGWHTTASLGALGTTVACAYLIGLPAARIVNALGLAVAQIAGCRENVGTDAKSFQAGHACALGVRAACLAETGFQAGPAALDGPHGYLQLYADGKSLDEPLAGLGQEPLELERSGLDIKQYPMCYAVHRVLDAVLDLRKEHDIRLRDVECVNVHTSNEALVPLVHPRPGSGLEGKFSLQYAIAAALADGGVRLASFTDEAVRRPEVQAFFERIAATQAAGSATPRWAEVTLSLFDGRRLTRRVDGLRGSHQHPVSDAELIAKLDDCIRWGATRPSGSAPQAIVGSGSALLASCHRASRLGTRALVAELRQAVARRHPHRF